MNRTEATLAVAKRLVALLEDNHEGLVTWNQAVTDTLRELADMVEPA